MRALSGVVPHDSLVLCPVPDGHQKEMSRKGYKNRVHDT